jgi:hypothetical protein
MAVQDKTRKILWARSGNRCAICRCNLLRTPQEADSAVVIGDECHIISREPDGPRGRYRKDGMDFDAYNNLIVLCKNDHKIIDDLQERYTVEYLHKVKSDHEKWVGTANYESRDEKHAVCYRITSGSQLLPILIDGEGWGFHHDDCQSDMELQLIGSFLQSLEDFIEFGDVLESFQRTQIQHEWYQSIKSLETAGFVVYGGKHPVSRKLRSGIWKLQICYIQILRIALLKANMGLTSNDQSLPKAVVVPIA